jgi:putative MATE family efflux protein
MEIKQPDSKPSKAKSFDVSHWMVIGLAVPMTLAYLTTPLLGLVDTAVVGRLGDAALIGGLAVGAIIIDVVFTTFNFLRAGTTGLTAQAVGREDEKEKQATLFRALIIAVLAGIVMVGVMPLILWLGLYFIAPGENVADATARYFSIRMLGAPFALANYAMLGWLIGLGRSGLGLVLQIVLNGTNIVLSVLLGITFGFGIEGVAAATIIGEVVATLLGGLICWRLLDRSVTPSRQRVFDKTALWKFANLNADIMLRSFILLFAFAYFTAQSSGFGEITLAANAVLLNFFLIAGYFLDGLATAAEQIVGRAIGARYKPAFWKAIRLTIFWNFLIAAVLSLTFLVFGGALINLITTLEPVQVEAQNFLIFASLTAVTGVLAFQMDGVFIGATWSREMSTMMVVSLIVYLFAWQILEPYGNTGLWLCLHIFLIVRGVTLSLRLPVKARQEFDN